MGADLPAFKSSQTAADTALVTVTPQDNDQLKAIGHAMTKLVAALSELAVANRDLTGNDDDDPVPALSSHDGAEGVLHVPKEIQVKVVSPLQFTREGAQIDGTYFTTVSSAVGALSFTELRMTRQLLYLASVTQDEAHSPLLTDDALQVQESPEKKLRITLTSSLVNNA